MKDKTVKILKSIGGIIARNPKKIFLAVVGVIGAINPELAKSILESVTSLSDILADVTAETPTEAVTEAPVVE